MNPTDPGQNRLAITYRNPAELRPDPQNPRLHPKSQIKRLASSIQTFGFLMPVLVDADDVVVAGHARLQAAQTLKLAEIPTLRVEHLSVAQLKAFRIADNRLAEVSKWDDTLLAQNLKELATLDLDFSLDVIGFDMGEIDLRIESLDAPDEVDTADELPPASKIVVSEPGDLWLLGGHRLLCADCREASSYERLMAGQLAAVVFTDPPYNVPIAGFAGGLGKVQHGDFAMATGEMSSAQFTEFLTVVLGAAARASKAGAIQFVCMDWRHMTELLAAGSAVYSELKNLCTWVKNVGGMGSMYRSRHELVFVFKHGTAPHVNNVELGRHGRYRTNVWEYKSIASSRHSTDEDDLLAMHPTVKPVRLVADALLDASNRRDIVLDIFLGSGTTLIAAHRAGRLCFGMEIDPAYIDVAICRWQADTGGDAVHAATGQTFTQRQQMKAQAHADAAKEVQHV